MRVSDWERRFTVELEARRSMAWSWSPPRHDCTSALALLGAMTALDWRSWWARTIGEDYETAAQAVTLTRRFGGYAALIGSMIGLMSASLGVAIEPIPPARAHRGDPVVVPSGTPFDVALGVVDLTGEDVLVADRVGWMRVPRSTAVTAWQVPF